MKCQVDSCLAKDSSLSIIIQSMTLEPGLTRSACHLCSKQGEIYRSPFWMTISTRRYGNPAAFQSVIVLPCESLSVPCRAAYLLSVFFTWGETKDLYETISLVALVWLESPQGISSMNFTACPPHSLPPLCIKVRRMCLDQIRRRLKEKKPQSNSVLHLNEYL